ncbi:MAG: nucleotide sugar epimerase [Anaerolineaceae bacterium 4572_78]|nr:MAG: nucleotide sugar epimerase [Anaerolineaceae bacterium 4572_78]
MANYVVTGTAGFIGSRVSHMLLEEGHGVIGIDNLNSAYDIRLKEWRLNQLKNYPNFTFARLDISDYKSLSAALENMDSIEAVINLAARAGVRASVEDPWVYVETNMTGTLNILELCRKHDIKKVVLASTSSLYGEHNPRPYQEDAITDKPLSPYAASKKGAEAMCYTYHYLYGIDVTVVRYFTVYGPAGRPDMSIFRFVKWISEEHPLLVYGDGYQERDFSYIDDIARGTIASLKPLGYEIINLGSDSPIVLNDVIGMIEKLTGKQALIERQPRHSADVFATWANINKAKKLLDWIPQVSFEQGVRNAIVWYQKNYDWLKDIKT